MLSRGAHSDQLEINVGKGSYSQVALARYKQDGKQYALKKTNLQKASAKDRRLSLQEAKLLSEFKHPNIVSYKDSLQTDGHLYIFMQYCEGGDLYDYLRQQTGSSLPETQVLQWFVQLAMALQYLHDRNIIHRDLKPEHIFLTRSQIIKVGSFGSASVLESSDAMVTTLIGTPYYMSPEMISNKPYNHKCDVWALGCIVYEMTTLKRAFVAKDTNSLVQQILHGQMPTMPTQYAGALVTLIQAMLLRDPDKRPSVEHILSDPFINTNVESFLAERRRRPADRGRATDKP